MSTSSRPARQPRVVIGTVVHCPEVSKVEIWENHAVGVGADGRIAFQCPAADVEASELRCKMTGATRTRLGEGQFLLPGFVDTHVHAPQYKFTGTGYDLPLLDWLNKYTFPVEAKFKDEAYARHVYGLAVNRLVKNGTTTACYFGTIHRRATEILADTIDTAGQRAYVGKVCMDCNAPDYYVETTAESAEETAAFVEAVLGRKNDRITPCITPRFAPTCSSQLLTQLGEIAAKHDVPIQSHLSENKAEIEWVKSLFPTAASYTDVYDQHGLLTNKTVMAHCVHITDAEMATLKARGTGVAHCACSNFNLMSGCLNVRRLLNNEVKVGLGTDISGGHAPSIMDAMRQSITASKVVFTQDQAMRPLDYKEALYLATQGGSDALGLGDQIGDFTPGKWFDAVVVDGSAIGSNYDVFSDDSVEDRLSKFVMLGDDRNVLSVYVAGDEIHSKPQAAAAGGSTSKRQAVDEARR